MNVLVFSSIVTVSYSFTVIQLPFIPSIIAYCLDTPLLRRTNKQDHISILEVRDRNRYQALTSIYAAIRSHL